MSGIQQMLLGDSVGGVVTVQDYWNPSNVGPTITLSGSNLIATFSGGAADGVGAIYGRTSGKWYWECKFTSGAADGGLIGIACGSPNVLNFNDGNNAPGSAAGGMGYYIDGRKAISGSFSSYGSAWTNGDVIGCYLDLTGNGTIGFLKNNVDQGVMASGILYGLSGGANTTYGLIIPAVGIGGTGVAAVCTGNFTPGTLVYAPPSGYTAGLAHPPLTYANWCATDGGSNLSTSNGGLTLTSSSTTDFLARGSMNVSSGSWYWEVKCNASSTPASFGIGIAAGSASLTHYLGFDNKGLGYYGNGNVVFNATTIATFASYAAGDIIGVALNAATPSVAFYKNGTLQGTLNLSTYAVPSPWYPAANPYPASGSALANFGASAFAYTPPSGFNAGLYQ